MALEWLRFPEFGVIGLYGVTWKLYDENIFHYSAVFIGSLLSFLPLYLEESYVEISPLQSALMNGQLFHDVRIVLLSLIAPLFIDSILDWLRAFLLRDKYRAVQAQGSKVDDCSFNSMERVLFIFGMVAVPVSIFISEDYPKAALALVCLRKCRFLLFAGAVSCSLCRKGQITPKSVSLLFITLYAIAQILGGFAANTSEAVRPGAFYRACYYLTMILGYGSFVVLFIYCVVWLFRVTGVGLRAYRCLLRGSSSDGKGGGDGASAWLSDVYPGDYLSYRIIFILSVIACALFTAVSNLTYKNNYYMDDKGLFLDSLPYVLFVLWQSALSMRLVKFEALQGLIALLDSKKQYVRYISHEIRTPLNATFLGLKILSDDLKESTVPKDVSRYETLCDINLSCTTAIDILNDLLTFEKLESGIMQLHKENVPALEFVEECVNLFTAQARSNNILMLLNPAPALSPSEVIESTALEPRLARKNSTSVAGVSGDSAKMNIQWPSPLLCSDAVSVDKFKMSQVVRNLISNALKFTPTGGLVTVNTAFIIGAKIRRTHDTSSAGSSKSKPLSRKSSKVSIRNSLWTSRPGNQHHRVAVAVDDRRRSHSHNRNNYRHSESSGDDNMAVHGTLQITVTDTGAGISADNQKKLFKDVVQFNPEKLQAGGGSGFGLFISKSIVDAHGGTISVFSEGEGKGCTFTIELPMKRFPVDEYHSDNDGDGDRDGNVAEEGRMGDSRDGEGELYPDLNIAHAYDVGTKMPSSHTVRDIELSVRSAGGGGAGGSSSKGVVAEGGVDRCWGSSKIHSGKRPSGYDSQKGQSPKYSILVVDDSKMNRKLLCRLLSDAGHTCEEADDGLNAVKAVRQRMEAEVETGTRCFDAILMDFVMPNLDGPGATKQIRDMGYNAPIYGVTGNGLQSDIDHFMSNGANKVFIKPFDIDSFHMEMLGR